MPKLAIVLICSLLGMLYTCNPEALKAPDYRTDLPATLRIVIEPEEELDTLQFDKSLARLTQRAEAANMVFNKIYSDEDKQQVIFDIIKPHNLVSFRKLITQKGKLEFWNTYRIKDENLLATIHQLDSTHQLSTYLELNKGNLRPCIFGMTDEKNKTQVEAILNSTAAKEKLPEDIKFLWSKERTEILDFAETHYELYMIKTNKKPCPIDEKSITYAKVELDEYTGEPMISLAFNPRGAKKWAEMTQAAAANDYREIAIVLDDKGLTAPSVRSPIMGGRSSITGTFTMEEAQEMADSFSAGALPCKFKIVEEKKL